MALCDGCLKAHKENGWYLSDEEKKPPVSESACDLHPRLENWRVVRTMKTLKYFSMCGENYRHSHCPGVRLTLSFGRVHRRTAEAILFDYEQPFIDLLIRNGFLEQEEEFDGVKRVLRVLPGSDAYLQKGLGPEKYEFFKKELMALAKKPLQKER